MPSKAWKRRNTEFDEEKHECGLQLPARSGGS